MQTNCNYYGVDEFSDACYQLRIGASYYTAGDFEFTPVVENKKWKSIYPYSNKYVHFRTDNGTIFQFRFDYFHGCKAILLTSTKRDVFWFFLPEPSFEHTMSVVRRAQTRRSVKGYHKRGDKKKTSLRWGGYFEDFYSAVLSHLDGMRLDAGALEIIYQVLLKKEKLYEV